MTDVTEAREAESLAKLEAMKGWLSDERYEEMKEEIEAIGGDE